eukprot:scaffold6610_cov163-Amphora_coffeaeformis.AAC.8
MVSRTRLQNGEASYSYNTRHGSSGVERLATFWRTLLESRTRKGPNERAYLPSSGANIVSIFHPKTKMPVARRNAKATLDLSRSGSVSVLVTVRGRASGATKSLGADTFGTGFLRGGTLALDDLMRPPKTSSAVEEDRPTERKTFRGGANATAKGASKCNRKKTFLIETTLKVVSGSDQWSNSGDDQARALLFWRLREKNDGGAMMMMMKKGDNDVFRSLDFALMSWWYVWHDVTVH